MNDNTNAFSTTPLFPLQTVFFPGTLLPLRIFEARYLDMISASLRTARPFGIVPIRSGHEVGATPDFFPFGTLATVESFDQGSDGLLHVRVLGTDRFRVENDPIAGLEQAVPEVVVLGGREGRARPQPDVEPTDLGVSRPRKCNVEGGQGVLVDATLVHDPLCARVQ